MADTKTQFKLNKLAKDLGLKGKDLIEILSTHGKEVTAQKTLDSSLSIASVLGIIIAILGLILSPSLLRLRWAFATRFMVILALSGWTI